MTLEPRPSDTFHPGDVLNNTYRIEGILGRGGTSEVYLGRSEISGRLVALKVLNAQLSKNADNLLLMTREEEIRDVRHDAVVRYSENNRTQDNHVYLVMDYVEGPRLDQVMAERDLSVDELLTIAARVLDGLVAIHARKIIHRDLSPDNIILRGGEPSEAVIIDFGIARDANVGAATIVGDGFAGKYSYAAPEQLSGDADARTDLYSLGALLLAAYRGKAPALGTNLLETVEAKKAPLDTSGVPEPLKSLIERLSAPDPADRPASAADALALVGPRPSGPPPDAEATVIGLGSERGSASAATAATAGAGARRPLMAVLAAGLVIAAAAGAYFSGVTDALFGPSYPRVDPYSLVVSKRPSAPPELAGHAPSEAAKVAFERLMADFGGSADVQLASGDLPDGWSDGVLDLVDRLVPLDDWQLAFEGGAFEAEGIVASAADRDLMDTLFAPGSLPDGFSGAASFAVGPRELRVADIRQVLDAHSDCGGLALIDPPPDTYPLGARILVEGTVASRQTADTLYAALSETAGERPVILDTDVLNDEVCLVEERLADLVERNPGVATFGSGQALAFTEGISGEPRPDGRFREGENPVIDLMLPPGVEDGYLWVTVVDVNGDAFHLLPNLRNPENDVRTIRERHGDTLRLSHPIGSDGKLAFQVDGTSGKSKILIFHASTPLFETPRPTSESIAGFASALEERMGEGGLEVYSLTEDIIETE